MDELLQPLVDEAMLSGYSCRGEWISVMAEIELSDSIDKLRPEIEDEKKRLMEVQESALVLGSEDYRSPAISSAFLRRVSFMIECCWSLPGVPLRAKFIRMAVASIMHRFLDFLLFRCQEAEGLTALTDDDALIKVTSRDYMKNRKQWLEKREEGWAVSKSFIGAIGYLQAKMSIIEVNLNKMDFVGDCRNLATDIDCLVFSGIFMSNTKLSDAGVERFTNDLTILFGVFKAWCLRPEGFIEMRMRWIKS
ncbi:RINT-1/TIP-1-like protein [Cynara cardunculus var. scolymus]|uniref:RINT-1/TIP-1-like protein n=1 Tax=Cynara cardunculus var. scolymus TaxID=59895 RepID=A0A118JZ55_CYNCS|nr:RINT-1/TIP-1-like protein [Cynara cardunculus var. scolymus]